MKILITNIWLHSHGGTEVAVRDLACELHKRGIHIEVYSPQLGPIANEIRNAGINIVDSVEELVNKPDLIHAQHFIPTMDVVSKFSDVPLIYFLHDRTHLIDTPPKYTRILRYIAVDYNCLDRLIIDNGIEKEKTDVLYNWVDTTRFKLRSEISEKPVKALVFSNYATHDNHFKIIQEACARKGIELDGLGIGLGNSTKTPEDILVNYDIVFAKAKAAMEAMATGAAVILCDFRGLGEIVSMKNFDHFRKYNFGMKTLTRPIDANLLIQEIEKYNPEEIKKTAKKIRNIAAFDLYVEKIISLYVDTIEKDLNNSVNIDIEDKRIVSEYQSLKWVLVQSKIGKYKEDLLVKEDIINKKNIQIQNLEKMINDLSGPFNSIKRLRKHRYVKTLISPFRLIKKLLSLGRKG